MEWISVKDRLPEKGQEVTAWRMFGGDYWHYQIITFWIEKRTPCWRYQDNWVSFHSITHWMPLPKPPKEV